MDFVIWSMVTRKIEREPVHYFVNDVPVTVYLTPNLAPRLMVPLLFHSL